jgi:hypothetical protein
MRYSMIAPSNSPPVTFVFTVTSPRGSTRSPSTLTCCCCWRSMRLP